MLKLVSATLIATAFIFTSTSNPSLSLAGTCASKCGPRPIEFTPGKYIRIEVLNSTSRRVSIERLHVSKAISLQPGQKLQLNQGGPSVPDISLVFWDETGLAIKAIASKPDFGTLRIELLPGNHSKSDRTVQIRDDGRINIF